MANIEIIQLNRSDWSLYKSIRLEALQTDPTAFGSSYENNSLRPDSEWINRLADAQKGEKQWLIFAKLNNQIIGTMAAYRKDISSPAAHITGAFVSPKFRGQGIGKQLMTDLINRIQQNPTIEKLELEVNTNQNSAIKLYEGLGFKTIRSQSMILGDGEEHLCLVMEKSLDKKN